MSFIAAVRVRVEREGRRGGSEKKKGSQRGDPNIHYSTFMCALLFFFSPFLFGKVLFSFFAAAFVRCKVSKPSPLTRSHASQPTSHSRQNVPRKKTPNKPKTKKTQPWFGRTRRSAAVTRESVALTFHLVTLQIETLQHKAKKVSN